MRRISWTSSIVAPPVENPVEVLTKSAPAIIATMAASMTLRKAENSGASDEIWKLRPRPASSMPCGRTYTSWAVTWVSTLMGMPMTSV